MKNPLSSSVQDLPLDDVNILPGDQVKERPIAEIQNQPMEDILNVSTLGNNYQSLDEVSTPHVDVVKSPSSNEVEIAHAEEVTVEEDLEEVKRKQGLAQIQLWLKEQTHISCRTDASFLLRFLRFQKFQLESATEQLQKYLRMRLDHPKWFTRLDVRDPGLLELIDGGYYFALPERDSAGRRVFFNKTRALDPSRHTSVDQMRAMFLCFESMLEDELNHDRGFTYILDEKDVGISYISLWTLADVTKAIQCCEKTLPIRHKQVNFLNLSSTFGTIFELVKSLLSVKINSRIRVHGDLESLHQVIDPAILPKEYGGRVPMADMISQYKQELEAVRSRVMALDTMTIGKKTSSSHSSNKLQRTIGKMQRSFKRLDID